MSYNKAEKGGRLAADVRRQFGAEATTRFLRNLPAFHAEADLPDRFKELLDRLDKVENDNWRPQ